MAATPREVSATELVDTKRSSGRRRRRQWPEMLKRRIVAETLEPGEPRPRTRRSGVIEIALAGGTRVSLRGEVSPEMLRQVIELLDDRAAVGGTGVAGGRPHRHAQGL